ncbi:MAG: type Z 30S ribosomal protein S14 [Patescibacteria group bacterium]
MATENQIAKAKKRKQKFSTREQNRCWRCGRKHGYIRDFGLCRICFRELALSGELPGIKKSSW